MAKLRCLLPILLTLGLAACGNMADLEPPATPPPPPPPAPAPAAQPPVEEPAPPPAAEPAASPPVNEFEDTDPTAISDFRPHLDPYGTWVEDPTYGHVWVPAKTYVSADFAPYVTSGHWALDANGDWLWVSDYDDSFGWVVFHYGRWVWVSGNGWVWIPGRRYAPAWVVWRVGDPGYDYVGWAPMPPRYYWRGGVIIWLDTYPPAPYVFCPTTHVFHHHVHHHIVERDRVASVAGNTRPYGQPERTDHLLASPHKGPSKSSGHVPSSAWPSSPHTQKTDHSSFSTPAGMGRPLPTPAAKPPSPQHVEPTHRFSPGPDQGGDASRSPDRAPPGRAPDRSPPPGRGASPGRAPAPGNADRAPAPPPQRSAPPPQRSAPPPQRSAPPPQRSAPPPAARPSPAPARPSPAPSRPSPSPSRSSGSSGRGKR